MNVLDWLAGESMRIAPWEAALRLAIAAVFGAIVGMDRELRAKPAGLRTHMLVSLAAALFTLITLELYGEVAQVHRTWSADPIRVIEAVTAGVAFLAAGAIIRGRGGVEGLTTGANMWFAGALGVACGGGYYTLALIGALFTLVIVIVLGWLERRVLHKHRRDRERL
ncbi:MAG: magnesium transporter MgtC [Proteobacteria bacterium]|nr:MAG: magnesium transporter MgtC [Pseudomonadota bacterium]